MEGDYLTSFEREPAFLRVNFYEYSLNFQQALVNAATVGMKTFADLRNSYGKVIAGCYSVTYAFTITKNPDGKIQFKILGITPSGEASNTDAQEHSIELDFGDPNQCK